MPKRHKFLHVVGARPNFMKAAPVIQALNTFSENVVLHTGQHTDAKMSDVVMEQLGLKPDVTLPHGNVQEMKINILKQFAEYDPEAVFVYGDVHSTLAGALAANHDGRKLYHVEAGLRSGDNSMPEEINRIVVDELSDVLFVTEKAGLENLQREVFGDLSAIHFVGNTMIDSLQRVWKTIPAKDKPRRKYVLMTLHRPSNVDDRENLRKVLETVDAIGTTVVFPVHPRTKKLLDLADYKNIEFVEPMDYVNFVTHMGHAEAVITDSGGVQEETTWLRVPCFTLRKNTERPCTIEVGTNTLVTDLKELLPAVRAALADGYKSESAIPEKWDGKAGERIAQAVKAEYSLLSAAQAGV
ncbi:MAG: UDP-N-acetylglucosamine 2-epimerase [Acidobacteriales bacterium]|nr:UDP-N-acetylglucosamine 2-epimerase [Terriglobales bacterium]